MTSRNDSHAKTRRMMETAIRGLNAIEYVILALAMAMALAAGALTAWLVQSATGASFRISWILASLLFFGVPGFLVLQKERQVELTKGTQDPVLDSTTKRDDG